MSLASRLKSNVRQLYSGVAQLAAKGHSSLEVALVLAPRIIAGRVYRAFARRVNGSWPLYSLSAARLRRFHRAHPAPGGHFYVIVMPGMLHIAMRACTEACRNTSGR